MLFFLGRSFQVGPTAKDIGSGKFNPMPPHPMRGSVGICPVEPKDTIILLRFADGSHDTFEARHLILIADPSAPLPAEA